MRGPSRECGDVGAASRNILGDRQFHRVLGCCRSHFIGVYGVAVHRGIVEHRQRQRRGHILGQRQAFGVAQFGGHGGPRGDQRGDDALMLLDRPHTVRPKTVGYQSSINSTQPCLRRRNT
jgi:hypothetical protein